MFGAWPSNRALKLPTAHDDQDRDPVMDNGRSTEEAEIQEGEGPTQVAHPGLADPEREEGAGEEYFDEGEVPNVEGASEGSVGGSQTEEEAHDATPDAVLRKFDTMVVSHPPAISWPRANKSWMRDARSKKAANPRLPPRRR